MFRCLLVTLGLCAVACVGPGEPKAQPPQAPHLATLDVLAGMPGGKGWVDGALAAAHFADPWAITGDGHGRLYVADANAIRAIDVASGSVTTLAGAPNKVGFADGVGAEAAFSKPSGMAFAAGQLYVADSENDTIRKIDVQGGAVTTIAGAAGDEQTVDAVGADARFRVPEGLAIDLAGNRLYIGDTESHAIRQMDLATGAVTTIAGSAGVSGNSDGTGTAALLNKPKALAVDGAGILWVIDSRNLSIRRVDPVTGIVSTVWTFNALPQGIVVDGADVLVSLGDAIAGDHRVARLAADGTVSIVAGSTGAPGFVDGAGNDARFDAPAGMWNDGAGNIYLADNGNYVIRKIVLSGPTVGTLAGAKSSGGADGTSAQARFATPQGLAVDEKSAYVADTGNHAIRKVALSSGAVTTLAGEVGQAGLLDGAARDARFNQPEGVALDPSAHQLYIADTGNHAIRSVDVDTGRVGTLTLAAAPGTTFAGLDAPAGLAFDRGQLFVTDYTNHVVVAIDLQKMQVATLAGQHAVPSSVDGVGANAGFYGPVGIAADGRGNLFVADYLDQTVRRIEIATATVATLAGQPVVAGYGDGQGRGALFHYPTAVAADGFGDVFVSDAYNNTVRHIDASGGTVTTIIGTIGAAGVRLGALPAQLAQPSALALTPSGGLLVVSENSILLAR